MAELSLIIPATDPLSRAHVVSWLHQGRNDKAYHEISVKLNACNTGLTFHTPFMEWGMLMSY